MGKFKDIRGERSIFSAFIVEEHEEKYSGYCFYEQSAGKTGIQKGIKKREALPRDGTLWIASHRDTSPT